MPELPEVETVKEALKLKIKGVTIADFSITFEKMLKNSDAVVFRESILGQEILDIKRRGKYLIFELSDYYLLSHLRMEGKYFYGNGTEKMKERKHVHAKFLLSDGSELWYEDVRKFGTFHLYEVGVDLEKTPSFSPLGLEPFDEQFTIEYFMEKIASKKKPIKSLLLDQSIVCGLGNIYVDEVLFMSRIHPAKKSGELTREEARSVVKYTKEILKCAIELKGTTIKTFTSEHGTSGEYQNELKVHTKKGERCPSCSAVIEKIKVGGRGTYFCPICQS